MSLKDPYLNVQGMSPDEAYEAINNCIDKHFRRMDKLSIPKYRFQQILNAVTHSPLSDADKRELRLRVQQLREVRKAAVQSMNEVQVIRNHTTSTTISKINPEPNNEPKPAKRKRIRPQFQTRTFEYVGRVNNLSKRILNIKTSEDAEAVFDKILRQRPAFTVNELNCAIELCQKLENQSVSKRLISLLSSLLKNAEERLDKNSQKYVEQMKKEPQNKVYVKMVSGGSPGLGKR